MDTVSYSKVELLALIKQYNKHNNDKIKNTDKMKKCDLLNICKKYGIIDVEKQQRIEVDLHNISKRDLQKDVQLYFLKNGSRQPPQIVHMNKNDLIDFMKINCIPHYDRKTIEETYNHLVRNEDLKNIIVYNIIKYDNVDVSQIDNDNLEEYIANNDLDTNIEFLQQYSVLLHSLYEAYEQWCKSCSHIYEKDKIRSFPKILEKLKNIL